MSNSFGNKLVYTDTVKRIHFPYHELDDLAKLPHEIVIADHKGGFNENFYNSILAKLDLFAKQNNFSYTIYTWEYYPPKIKNLYSNLNFIMSMELFEQRNSLNEFTRFKNYKDQSFEKFLCSFNGTNQSGRVLLVSALNKLKFFDKETCSKNFSMIPGQVDSIIAEYLPDQTKFYRKFFVDNESDFESQIIKFGDYGRWSDKNNWQHIYEMSGSKISRCFLHLVSETCSLSYYPFVTEKFLLSVINKGLFLAYAQPGYHAHLEESYGFKPYGKLFDYSFDNILNPVKRLLALLDMISKFQHLKTYDWHDLYHIELDTINYNYDHYFSGDYKKSIAAQADWP